MNNNKHRTFLQIGPWLWTGWRATVICIGVLFFATMTIAGVAIWLIAIVKMMKVISA